MGKSARILGLDFGQSARDMNALLKKHGYLEGEPGAYGLTDKGKSFAEEEHHSRGTGGYAHYNRNWETRTWNEETANALRADMEANPDGVETENVSVAAEDNYEEPLEHHYEDPANFEESDGVQLSERQELIARILGLSLVGVVAAAPHVKPFWNNRMKPTAKNLRKRFTKPEA